MVLWRIQSKKKLSQNASAKNPLPKHSAQTNDSKGSKIVFIFFLFSFFFFSEPTPRKLRAGIVVVSSHGRKRGLVGWMVGKKGGKGVGETLSSPLV